MKINVIVRDENNIISNVFRLTYNQKKYNDLNSIFGYLNENIDTDGMLYYCEYDIECKKQFLYCLSKKKKKLDLEYDFDELNFDDFFKITKNEILTINAKLTQGGIGGWKEIIAFLEFIFFIRDLLKELINLIIGLFVIMFPFYNIKKKYGYGKNFIYNIIIKNENWNYGFFNLKKVRFNKLLERSVMFKLGYRLKNKKWYKKVYHKSVNDINRYELY